MIVLLSNPDMQALLISTLIVFIFNLFFWFGVMCVAANRGFIPVDTNDKVIQRMLAIARYSPWNKNKNS